jgi:hypothetical protein
LVIHEGAGRLKVRFTAGAVWGRLMVVTAGFVGEQKGFGAFAPGFVVALPGEADGVERLVGGHAADGRRLWRLARLGDPGRGPRA